MNKKYILYISVFFLQNCLTFMTLDTWTERDGCPIYSGVRVGCGVKLKPGFRVNRRRGLTDEELTETITDILGFPFNLAADTFLLPISIPFALGNTLYYANEDRKLKNIYEQAFPLHYAIEYNQKEKAIALIKKGVNIHNPDSNDQTPIKIALNRVNYEIAILLLEKGAILYERSEGFYQYILKSNYKNIELISKHQPYIKNGLLFTAVVDGNLDLAKSLINLNANVNYFYDDAPVLFWACNSGKLDIVTLLLEKGANVNIRYEHGDIRTPFTELVDDFLRHDELKEKLVLIRLFFKYGAKIGKSKEDISDAVVLFGRLLGTADNDIIFLLLKHGLNVNEKGHNDKSLLQMALEKGDLKVIKYLNEHGASIKKINPNDLLRIFLEARRDGNNKVELVRYFLETKLINANRTVDGEPLLCIAYTLEFAKLLVEYGANVNAKIKKSGDTPLAIAVYMNNLDIVNYLISKGANKFVLNNNQETLLSYTTGHENVTMAKFLIENGLDVNEKNINQETVVLQSFFKWQACSGNPSFELAQLFIDYGADINAQNNSGSVAIHCAALTGNLNSIKFLLKRGANINIRDKEGLSALDYAMKYDLTLTQIYLKSNGAN